MVQYKCGNGTRQQSWHQTNEDDRVRLGQCPSDGNQRPAQTWHDLRPGAAQLQHTVRHGRYASPTQHL